MQTLSKRILEATDTPAPVYINTLIEEIIYCINLSYLIIWHVFIINTTIYIAY